MAAGDVVLRSGRSRLDVRPWPGSQVLVIYFSASVSKPPDKYNSVFVVSRRRDMKAESVDVRSLGSDLNNHNLLVESLD